MWRANGRSCFSFACQKKGTKSVVSNNAPPKKICNKGEKSMQFTFSC